MILATVSYLREKELAEAVGDVIGEPNNPPPKISSEQVFLPSFCLKPRFQIKIMVSAQTLRPTFVKSLEFWVLMNSFV